MSIATTVAAGYTIPAAIAGGAMVGPQAATTTALPGFSGALGIGAGVAALAGFQQFQTNRAIGRTLNNLAGAASTNIGQINEQAVFEQFKERQNLRRTLGRVATAIAAAQGGVTARDLRAQAIGDSGVNQFIIDRNRGSQTRAVNAQYDAEAARLRAQWQSPIIAGVQAGLGGFAQGISLFSGLNQLEALQGVRG